MDYIQRIKDRERELSELRKRQDADKDLLYLSKYTMKDIENKTVPDIINVTLNRPAVFAANVISALGKVSEQIIVETEKKGFDTAYVEQFHRACLASANARLRKRGKPELNPFFDEQTSIRGGVAARVAFQMVDGILVPDMIPWDYRYFTWEMGIDELDYGAYTSSQLKSEVQSQLWYKESKDRTLLDRFVNSPNARFTIRDVWDSEHNEIWIDNNKAFEQGHDWGFTPVTFAQVPLGSMLADTDAEAHHGESIFFLIRTVLPELNRLVSIMQTLNLKAIKAPMKAKKKGGGEAPQYEDVTGAGAITTMEPDEDIQPIDYGDAKRAAELAYNMFDKALQEGSLTSIDLGRLDFQLSAIALIEIGEGRDQVFKPRLDTKSLINKEIVEMFTKQCIQIGGTLEIGTPGHKRSFDMSKIEGEYETTFKYYPKSPKIDMARYSMAAQAKTIGLIPDKSIATDILQREDPDGDERQLRREQAEMLSPIVRLRRIIKSLYEDAERGDDDAKLDAQFLELEMGVTLEQMMAGQLGQTPQVEDSPKPNPVQPGLTGKVPNPGKQASDLMLTP